MNAVFAYGLMPPPTRQWEEKPWDELELYGLGWWAAQKFILHARESKIGPKRADRPRRRISVHKRILRPS